MACSLDHTYMGRFNHLGTEFILLGVLLLLQWFKLLMIITHIQVIPIIQDII